jgi:hypothetical protein
MKKPALSFLDNFSMLHGRIVSALVLLTLACSIPQISPARRHAGSGSGAMLLVTDYVKADGKTDVADALQKLINDNPNRTLYFPDGVYLVSHPILTPADPRRSVQLELSNYARIVAAATWADGGAMVRLGGCLPANDISTPGSNYGLRGGIIDGNGVADGISIESGRETKIQNVSIKNTRIGIYVKYGANSGSSDADISDVNIVGNNHADAVGVLVDGFDNTFTNMRIAAVNVGFHLRSAGNNLRNIHPLYLAGKDQDYPSSCGFWVEREHNWLTFCYSDNMATAYRVKGDKSCTFTDCFAMWYSAKVPSQTVFETDGPFQSFVSGLRVGFRRECDSLCVLRGAKGGSGRIFFPMNIGVKLTADDVSGEYICKLP